MTVVDLYTVQILCDEPQHPGHMIMEPAIAETEENLTDLLPDGYRAVIRRWNDPEPTQEDDDE